MNTDHLVLQQTDPVLASQFCIKYQATGGNVKVVIGDQKMSCGLLSWGSQRI